MIKSFLSKIRYITLATGRGRVIKHCLGIQISECDMLTRKLLSRTRNVHEIFFEKNNFSSKRIAFPRETEICIPRQCYIL